MSDIKRVRRIINWLIFQEFASNERELAELMGYTKSSFSQLINGKVPLSDKFIENLTQIDDNINKVWIVDGVGNMFKDYSLIRDTCAPTLLDAKQGVVDGDDDEGMMSRLRRQQSKDGGDANVKKIGIQEIEMLFRIDIQKIEIESLKRELKSKDKIIEQLINKLGNHKA